MDLGGNYGDLTYSIRSEVGRNSANPPSGDGDVSTLTDDRWLLARQVAHGVSSTHNGSSRHNTILK